MGTKHGYQAWVPIMGTKVEHITRRAYGNVELRSPREMVIIKPKSRTNPLHINPCPPCPHDTQPKRGTMWATLLSVAMGATMLIGACNPLGIPAL